MHVLSLAQKSFVAKTKAEKRVRWARRSGLRRGLCWLDVHKTVMPGITACRDGEDDSVNGCPSARERQPSRPSFGRHIAAVSYREAPYPMLF